MANSDGIAERCMTDLGMESSTSFSGHKRSNGLMANV